MKYLKITSPDVNNGPGFRATLWLPGCKHNCKGCQNAWTHNYDQGEDFTKETYDELISILKCPYITGLTISGGDPLYQSNGVLADLYKLICKVKADVPDKTVWLYTGFKYEDLQGIQMDIVQKCDVVVDGPFIEELKDVGLPFRGSSNQRIIHIGKTQAKEDQKPQYIIEEQKENNMKKTIFKGIINGQEFDNVQSYNNKMNELLSAGEPVNASTSTQIVEAPDNECGRVCKCQGGECACGGEPNFDAPKAEMIPVFQNKPYQSVGAFLDDILTENINENEAALDNLSSYLFENYQLVVPALTKLDAHALENYKMDLTQMVNEFKRYIVDNNDAIANVQTKLKVLHAGSKALDIINDAYMNIIDAVDEEIRDRRAPRTKEKDWNAELQKATEVLKIILGGK